MNLSTENIEEYLLLLADNELDEAEENKVMAFIEQHAIYKPMLEAYLATRLDSAEPFIFPDKELLLKTESIVLPLRRSNIKPLKLAAAIAVLLGIGIAITLMFAIDPVNKDEVLATKNKAVNNKIAPSVENIKDTTAMIAQVSKQKNASERNSKKQQKVVFNQGQNTVAHTIPVRQEEQVPASLASASVTEMSLDVAIQPQTIAMVEEAPLQEREHNKSLPEWLPVTAENLQGVNDLVAHIQALKENIQEKAQSLKNTAFVIRFGDKQISIGK
jgi:hypothetical protein